MLGWHISCYPKPDLLEWEEHRLESTGTVYCVMPKLAEEDKFATWDATVGGLQWLASLVQAGKAEELAINGGYPLVYELSFTDLLPILENPPALYGHLRTPVLTPPPPERIIITAWDQS